MNLTSRPKTAAGRGVRVRFYVMTALIVLLFLFSLIAPLLEPNDPNATNPFQMGVGPCSRYPLGTDLYGRCILSRVLDGARTSIFSAVLLVLVTFLPGTLIGMAAGWHGGAADSILMRLTDWAMAFPQMVLAIAVAGVLGGGLSAAILALGITGWTLYARQARSYTLSLKKENFLTAARLYGESSPYILMRHVLPNIFGPMAVSASTQIGTNLIAIAGLSFLGLGVTPPQAEWGSMINENRAYMELTPWSVWAPAIAILVTVILFNYFGDTVRNYLEERGKCV